MDEKKVQEMQFLEQNLQNLMMQKQAFQMELSETESALSQIKDSGDEVFKVIGQLMIKTNKDKIQKDLDEKQKVLQTRLNSLEKQETSLSEKLEEIREEVMGEMNKK